MSISVVIKRKSSFLASILLMAIFITIWLFVWFLLFPPGVVTRDPGRQTIMFVILAFFFVIAVYAFFWQRAYRLELTDSQIRVRNNLDPLMRKLTCDYADIKRVTRGDSSGTLAIVFGLSKTSFYIDARRLEGGAARVIQELSRRLPPGVIDAGLTEVVQVREPASRATRVISICMFLSVVIGFLAPIGLDLVQRQVAWVSVPAPFWEKQARSFSVSDQGAVWVALNRGFTDAVYDIRHDVENDRESWRLVVEQNNQHSMPDLLQVSGDEQGRPWVLLSDGRILHWNGSSWGSMTLFDERFDAWATDAVVSGANLWVIAEPPDSEEPVLYQANIATGDWGIVRLPEALEQRAYVPATLYALRDGYLLVHFWGEDSHVYHMLRDGQWQSLRFTLEDIGSDDRASDFYLDSSDRLWVMNTGYSGNDLSLGAYDATTQAWDWIGVEGDPMPFPINFVVDGFDRLWLFGRLRDGHRNQYLVNVYQINENATATQILSYTRENSNFQVHELIPGIQMGQDGRIWSGGRRMVWIDSTAVDLQQPLPDWIAAFNMQDTQCVWYGVWFAIIVGLYLVLRIRMRLE